MLSLLLVDQHQTQTHPTEFTQLLLDPLLSQPQAPCLVTMATAISKSHDNMRKDVEIDMVERSGGSSSEDLAEITKSTTMGTVTISDSHDILLVPTPSADPRGKYDWGDFDYKNILTTNTDPLNMPVWRKRLLVVLVSICMTQQLFQWILLTHLSLFRRLVDGLRLWRTSGILHPRLR